MKIGSNSMKIGSNSMKIGSNSMKIGVKRISHKNLIKDFHSLHFG